MIERKYGEKYASTQGLKRPEIAKLIREDIKAAVKAGTLPKGRYSVRTESYSGGGSIDITVSDVVGIPIVNLDRLRWHRDNPHATYGCEPANVRDRYTPEMREVIAKLERIHGSYNYDGSDSMADYYDVRYYGTVTVDCTWEVNVGARELTAASTEPRQVEFLSHLGV